MPGKHSLEGAIPISTILRDYLHVCDNHREAKFILNSGAVLIDQRVVRKPKYPVGLMDVVSLPSMKKHYRTMIDDHSRLQFVEIKAAEAQWKLLRVENKTIVKDGKVQLNLHDGTNTITDKKIKTGDVLQLSLPDMKVKKVIEFKEGAQAFITGGSHVGSFSEIKGIEITRSTKPNLVMYDDFQTIKPYSFVVGDKKALVTLPEVKL
jgi:small subunit ribosomal protein S4e